MSRRISDYSSKRPRVDDYYVDEKREYDRKDYSYSDYYQYDYRSSKRPRTDYIYDSRCQDYRTLYLCNLNNQISESYLSDVLHREFRKFGDFNMRVLNDNGKRIAYLTFRNPEDAKEAKHERQGHQLCERKLQITAVYERDRHSDYYDRRYSPPTNDRRYSRSSNRSREAKFPHHLQHIAPEDDDKATRTLFVGNLSVEISEDHLRELFEKYGNVMDVDVKRPAHGQGNAYAFVKYENLDMAHSAKVNMSGKQIGQFQCKIGYGKPHPSNCLWVGNLGPSVREEQLEREFDRFGVIHRIFWPHGESHAYILFDNVDAAQAARAEMRGCALGGKDFRLRIDFADASVMDLDDKKPVQVNEVSEEPCKTVDQLIDSTKQIWTGTLTLKNSVFPAKMHLIQGNEDIVLKLAPNNEPLKITQRLRLDQNKVADVHKKLETAGEEKSAVLLAIPESDGGTGSGSGEAMTRQLSTLINYLHSKEAAGVVPLTDGIIHAFPPCKFAMEFLRSNGERISEDKQQDDHMVVIIVQN